MKKSKLIVAAVMSLCLVGGGVCLTACNKTPQTSDKNSDIYAVYQTYVAYAEQNSQTPLSYEDWLNTIKGADGKDGKDGKNGEDGTDGKDGKSAYEIWKEAGNEGTEDDFLNSLKGSAGSAGTNGTDGKSAYEIWKEAGNEGTEDDFLNSLKGSAGTNGTDGKSAYEIWKEAGNEGTEDDFLNSLKGEAGAAGATGEAGKGIEKVEYSTDGLSLVITYTDKTTVNVPIPDKHTHEYGAYITVVNPTCDNEGLEIAYCATCNEAVARPVAALGHDYVNWDITKTPTATETGEATGSCKNDATHTLTVTLPVLGSEEYYVSPDTATCEAAGKITYTYKQYPSLTIDEATPALGHNVQIIDAPVEGGGEVRKICTTCGEGSTYAYGKGYSLSTLDMQTLADNTVHYVSTTKGGKVPFRFTVGASGSYTVNFENIGASKLMFYGLNCVTVNEDGTETSVAWAAGRGYAATSLYKDYFSITTSNGVYTPGDTVNAPQKFEFESLTFNFAEEHVGKIMEIGVYANATAAIPGQYFISTGSAQIASAPMQSVFKVGTANLVIPEGAYLSLDETSNKYTFTAPKAGWYKLVVPDSAPSCMVMQVEGETVTDVLDTADTREYIFEATQGQQFTYAFVNIGAKKYFDVTLEETQAPSSNTLKVGEEKELVSAGGNPRTGSTNEVVVDASVAQGTYTVIITPTPMLGRCNFYVSTNNAGYSGVQASAVNKFTAQIELKGGDTLYITSDSLTSGGYYSVMITPVTA